MKRMLATMIMTMLLVSQTTSFAEDYEEMPLGPDGEHYILEERPDGMYGYQWYEESWVQLESVTFAVDKKGNCTSITGLDRGRGMKLSFDFTIVKSKLPKYKLAGNKFFYNYQADWFQVETKGGDIVYTDVWADPSNGELYNIIVNK